jgi:hypothetical protein
MNKDTFQRLALILLFVGIVAFTFLSNGCQSMGEKKDGKEGRQPAYRILSC